MTRKQEREQAFLFVFEKAFTDDTVEEIIELATEVHDYENNEYVNRIFKGVYDNLSEIDEAISQDANGWKIERISKVTLCAMRIAIYEMKFENEIPISVSINEAVEIIKKFATKQDASYANGILGSVSKSFEKGE